MNSRRFLATSAALFAGCAALTAQTYTFEPFAVKNPKAPRMGTYSQGASSDGAVAGYLTFRVIDKTTGEAVPATVGFRRYKGGAFEYPITAPGDANHLTQAEAVNGSGTIVGRYKDGSGIFHGFLLSGGKYQTIDEGGGPNTWAMGINNAGSFAGSFGAQTPPEHGFISAGGQMTQIDVPGAASTLVTAIAQDGTVVGCTGYPNNQAFVRGPKGNYLIFQASGARITCATSINDASTMIAGFYNDQSFNYHGFVYNYAAGFSSHAGQEVATLPLVTVDYPGAALTTVTGIDAHGNIFGTAQFVPQQGAEPAFGFIGTPNQ